MKYLQLFEHIIHNKKLRDLIKNSNVSPIFHAIKSEYAVKALEDNKLGGYSIQRTWEGGKRLKDDNPDYESSDFMRGISLTRDPEYARFNDIMRKVEEYEIDAKKYNL